MTDPTSTEFVGSHEKSRAGYGTNGDPNPSSVPLTTKPKLVEPKVAPAFASVPGLDHRDTLAARVSGISVPHSHNEHHRTSGDGNPGGAVPSNNRPVTKPARPGTFNRS